jgi:adhesin transport system outer membrane protein
MHVFVSLILILSLFFTVDVCAKQDTQIDLKKLSQPMDSVVFEKNEMPDVSWNIKSLWQEIENKDLEWQQAQLNYQAQKQSINIAQASLLPTVQMSASRFHSRISPQDRAQAFNNIDRQSKEISRQISINQPIWVPKNWFNYQSAKALDQQVELDLQLAKMQLILKVVDQFMLAAKADIEQEFTEEVWVLARLGLDQAYQAMLSGAQTKIEYEQARAFLDIAHVDKMQAEQAKHLALQRLSYMSGQSVQALDYQGYGLDILEKYSFDQLKDLALVHPLILKTQFQSKIAEQDRLAKIAEFSPELFFSAVGGRSVALNEGFFDPTTTSALRRQQIGFNLSWTLFEGGRNMAQVKQAKALESAERLNITIQQDKILKELDTLYDQYRGHLQMLAAQALAVNSSKQSLDSIRVGFKVGTYDSMDVALAKRQWLEAKKKKSVLELDIWLTEFEILANIGNLNEQAFEYTKTLKPIVAVENAKYLSTFH